MKECVKCGKLTNKGFSIDIDCSPTPACDDCYEDVRHALTFMMLYVMNKNDVKMVNSFTKKWHKPIKL